MNNPFWQFSLEVYNDSEIETLCLALQNHHHFDVNELLFSVWLACELRILNLNTLTSHPYLRSLQQDVIKPLRQARLSMRALDKQHSIYQKLKGIELETEQEIQLTLWSLSSQFSLTTDSRVNSKDTSEKLALIQELIKGNIHTLWSSYLSTNALSTTPLSINPLPDNSLPDIGGENSWPIALIQFCEWMNRYVAGKI